MAKPLVSDELWGLVEPLIPKVERRYRFPGRKRIDDRKVLTAMRNTTAYVNASDSAARVACGYTLRGRHRLVYATLGSSLPSTDSSLSPCPWEEREGD